MKSAPGTLLVILGIAFVSPLLATALKRWHVPALVFEILLGILVGPAVIGLVAVTEPIELLHDLGLAALIFLAGFELDPKRMKGKPLELATTGWIVSIVLALAVGAVLQMTGVILSELYVGLALTTTALGTLLPILRDAGLLPTAFGTHVLAVGSVGEFGPIIAVALLLSGASPSKAAVALAVFAIVAMLAVVAALRFRPVRLQNALMATLRSSGQLYVRLALLLVALLAFAANELGLDFLLGAFTAGIVYRLFLTMGAPEEEIEMVETKLEAVCFGYLVPIFFVVTGITFDLEALTSNPSAMLKVPLFLALFLLVRGVPTVLYRSELPSGRLRLALAMFSATALPLVVVITEIGVQTGQMRSSTAAALVGAGMISVVVYPPLGLALAKDVTGPPAERDVTAG